MTKEKAEKLFEEKYEEATKHEHIENKAAWALYQAWQEADKHITKNQAIDRLEALQERYNSAYYDPAINMAIEALSSTSGESERETAKWIPYPSLYSDKIRVTCSHCTYMQDKPTSYCSSCGAKMRQGEWD